MQIQNFISKYEYECVVWAIKACNGKISDAAKVLRCNRTTLHAKLKSFGIDHLDYSVKTKNDRLKEAIEKVEKEKAKLEKLKKRLAKFGKNA